MGKNTDVPYLTLSEDGSSSKNSEAIEMTSANINEESPGNSSFIIHVVPEANKTRWNHIEDLDTFFKRTYNYHQQHGFIAIVLDHIFQLSEFGFVICLLTFTVYCMRHSVLFGDSPPAGNHTKVALSDVIIPMGECVQHFNGITYTMLGLAGLCFVIRLIRLIHRLMQYLDIKRFYNTALHIEDSELGNTTWHDVKQRIREVQSEQEMCIDKQQLTELDVCHRIVRFPNYMVALLNQNLLPVRYNVPLLGELVALSRGLLINIEFILFRGPGAPFQNNCLLRDEYTKRSNQTLLAQRLAKLIFWMAIANFVFAPIIFLWQLIYICFSYANILRKEPDALGMRTWSNYGRLHMRHFNELEHELDARLNRAYAYANRYLSSFSSPVMAVIAKNLLFISGGMLVLILALGIYDEYVFHVEHVLTIVTVLTAIGLACRTLIPDENLVWCPEQLMTAILAHVHYIPADWKHKAHTSMVRKEFSNFFQPRALYLLNEIFSPLTTPFLLMFVLRPKALEMVNFFRSFTVKVRGVGHVCSFAEMDLRKHGNQRWQLPDSLEPEPIAVLLDSDSSSKNFDGIDNGKTELSLVHFSLTNPEWQMPAAAANFIRGLRENAQRGLLNSQQHVERNMTSNPITESLLALGTMGAQYSTMATSVFMAHNIPTPLVGNSNCQLFESQPKFAGDLFAATKNMGTSQYFTASSGAVECRRQMRVSKTEGRLEAPKESLLCSLNGLDPRIANSSTNIAVADMCLSTLYLHELHKRNTEVNTLSSTDAVPETSAQAQKNN